jgi:hypothetical protein
MSVASSNTYRILGRERSFLPSRPQRLPPSRNVIVAMGRRAAKNALRKVRIFHHPINLTSISRIVLFLQSGRISEKSQGWLLMFALVLGPIKVQALLISHQDKLNLYSLTLQSKSDAMKTKVNSRYGKLVLQACAPPPFKSAPGPFLPMLVLLP